MTALTDRPVRLQVASTPAHLAVVRAATEAACRLVGFDARCTTEVVLSVGEALANIVRHAYGGAGDGPIEIELSTVEGPAGDGLRVRLRDCGRGVEPRRLRRRDPSALRAGGRGVHIMRQCMDVVDYQQAEGGGTVLTMFKRLPTGREGPRP